MIIYSLFNIEIYAEEILILIGSKWNPYFHIFSFLRFLIYNSIKLLGPFRNENIDLAILTFIPVERGSLENIFQLENEEKILFWNFRKGKKSGKKILSTRCGVGTLRTLITGLLTIFLYNPKKIIFFGVAGSYRKYLNCGDILLVEKSIDERFRLGIESQNKGEISKILDAHTNIVRGTSLTAKEWITDEIKIKKYGRSNFQIEDAEDFIYLFFSEVLGRRVLIFRVVMNDKSKENYSEKEKIKLSSKACKSGVRTLNLF